MVVMVVMDRKDRVLWEGSSRSEANEREEIGSKQAQTKSKMKVRYGILMTRNDTRIYEYNCLEQRKGRHVKNIEVSVEDRLDRYRDQRLRTVFPTLRKMAAQSTKENMIT